MAPTSIYRRPGAQHFQLVHRSQRDPLINDPEASARVLKQVDVGQVHKVSSTRGLASRLLERPVADAKSDTYVLARAQGKGRAAPDDADTEAGVERRRGEASQWGILFDDSEYDYMQHLRQVGLPSGEGDVEGVLIAAPAAPPKPAQSGKTGKKDAVADMFNKPSAPAALPSEALPSKYELSMAEAQAGGSNIPLELQGLQPDMDPHLRQVLEALNDDAFLAAVPDSAESDGEEDLDGEGEGDEDWLEELLLEGAVGEDEEREEFEFHEWGLEQERKGETLAKGEETWEDRFKQFKLAEAAKKSAAASAPPLDRRHGAGEEDDDDFGTDDGSAELYGTEMADELGSLGGFGATGKGSMVVGGKRRARTDASGYSMSSSSMFRNKGLSTLDEQFDQVRAMRAVQVADHSC
jgi:protein LTV1